ncbi:MAG TPA: hypothetical protein H9881_18125 [Candidatus Stackebrandtia excrementipullorum]|nr:hypothetical protein [Candidatus Stackebrandtia excrementipullorum]
MTYPPPQGLPGDPHGQQPPTPPWDGSYAHPPMSGVPASGQPDPYGQQPMGQPPGHPGAGYPGAVPYSPYGQQQLPPTNNGSSKAWIWGGLAGLVVVALMVTGVLYFTSSGGDEQAPVAETSESAAEEPTEDPTTEPDPNTELYTEHITGLSYEPMEDPWREAVVTGMPGFHGVVGQYLDVLEFDSGSGWVASFLVGELDADAIGYTGEDSLEAAVEAFADVIDDNNYHAPPDFTEQLDGFERSDISMEEYNVEGHNGMWMSYHLSWDDDRIEETGESVAVGVVDAGDGLVAGFFLSLPDSVPDSRLDQMLAALDSLTFI